MAATLTAVAGVAVGHAHDVHALTGCTVVLFPDGTTAGVDVRGGAPATRETDLLRPEMAVQHIHAICLAGGSAYGLAAATGVMSWLREQGRGFDVRVARVPIVPAACIFDLALGRPDVWPDADMGYAACQAATTDTVAEGCVGAGVGAAVGKLPNITRATKSGLGCAAITLPSGVTVAALAVCNAWGDVRRDSSDVIIAGARRPEGGFVDMAAQLRGEAGQVLFGGSNTTLAVIATDATLTKADCTRLAHMAQDGLARTIRPIHTPFDGDVVFATATNTRSAPHLAVLGIAAADVLAAAIERCVLQATGMGGLPAARDLYYN